MWHSIKNYQACKESSMGRKLTRIDPALIQILELAVKDIKTVTVTEVYLLKELDGNMKKV